MPYHYTYIIRNKLSKRLYIGVRSCKCYPKDDTEYMSSSQILKEEVKNNKHVFQKRILRLFPNRKEAMDHEIYLHEKYDVDNNQRFYNKVKQLVTGFSNAGRRYKLDKPFTEEHKRKISNAAKKRTGKKGSFYGKKHSQESIEKIRKASLNQKNRVGGFKGKYHSAGTKEKLSKNSKNRKWFNDGVTEYLFWLGKEPSGYTLGRLSVCKPRSKNTKNKISESKKGQKWYTNGIDTICCQPGDQPEGFVLGRKINCQQMASKDHSTLDGLV